MNLRARSWVVIFSTLFALGLTASLGFWQLGRASTKIALQESIADKNSKDPLSNSSVSADDSEASSGVLLHRSVRISGHWQTHNTTYLDNRQMGARQGFFVLTPLRLTGSNVVVVVQRGWIPRDFQDRTRLAAVTTSANEVVVNGRVTAAPSAIYALGKEAAGVSGQIMQNLDSMTKEEINALMNLDKDEQELLDSIENDDWVSIPNSKLEIKHFQATSFFIICTI